MDDIKATPIAQPLPDSVTTMWDKITQRAVLNKDKDITWEQVEEVTGGQPPLKKEQFDTYTAGELSLSAEGLVKLKEKQASDARR